MGGGSFDSVRYTRDTDTRRAAGVADFHHSATARSVHASLAPQRINSKVFGKLESRDSSEHPDSNAVIVGFDVTGSNRNRAVVAQKALPTLMSLLPKYLPDPQIAIAANDDWKCRNGGAVQFSEFESDNRVDDHLRNIWLVGDGGANDGESYDLLVYAAARKTVLDCYEKRGRRGYLFLYADEPFMQVVSIEEVADTFGDRIPQDIPIQQIINEAREMYHVFILWPVGGYDHAYNQYQKLFGVDNVITLQDPSRICEVIGVTIGVNENKISAADAVDDLVSVGVDRGAAAGISKSLVKLSNSRSMTKVAGGLPAVSSGRGRSARL